MATSPHLAITLVEQAQSQKEVTVNMAINRIDALLNAGVIDKDLATPPGSPAEGDVYIIAASPTGAWTGNAKHIAFYSSGWKFIAPREGLTLWVNDENLLYSYDGSNWSTTWGISNINLLDKILQRVELKDYSETLQGVTASASTTIDLENGNAVDLTHGTNISTLTFSNSSATGRACSFKLIRKKDNSATPRTISWPASVKWPAATAPTLTQAANAVDILSFMTTDEGITWYGQVIGLNMS